VKVTKQAQCFYEFGLFQVDAAKRILLRAGEVVPLTPKCFDILLALVGSSGEVIGKDDLMKRVWPDSFVEEGNLTYNISMLRKALGEKASEHQYIVTIPGRGYQFSASVRELSNESPARPAVFVKELASEPVASAKPT
jgi:DNA-binding winged helix-turn-helix (wHTH) protein